MSKLIEVYNIFNSINNLGSRNDKERVLKQNEENLLFKRICKFVYDPYVTTGLNLKKLSKEVNMKPIESIENISQLMKYLKYHNTGRDIDIVTVQEYINNAPKVLKQFIKEVCTKSLKCGLSKTTLNKIYREDFIPTFDVMKAYKYFGNEKLLRGREFILTEKLDGLRNVLIKENGTVKMFTCAGQKQLGFEEIEKEAEQLPDNYVYDGEMISMNIEGLFTADLFRKTMSKARKKGTIKTAMVFNCFDMVPLEDFKRGICRKPCIERKKQLAKVLKALDLLFIQRVPVLYIGTDKKMVDQILEEVLEEKKEGLMLNFSDGPYECKRTKAILKIKKFYTCDLRVIGFEEGTGKNKGTLGAITVDYKGYKLGVGSGFSDEMREIVWNHQNKYKGMIAEVQCFGETSNQEGGKSLRFPVFKQWRADKKEVSYE